MAILTLAGIFSSSFFSIRELTTSLGLSWTTEAGLWTGLWTSLIYAPRIDHAYFFFGPTFQNAGGQGSDLAKISVYVYGHAELRCMRCSDSAAAYGSGFS